MQWCGSRSSNCDSTWRMFEPHRNSVKRSTCRAGSNATCMVLCKTSDRFGRLLHCMISDIMIVDDLVMRLVFGGVAVLGLYFSIPPRGRRLKHVLALSFQGLQDRFFDEGVSVFLTNIRRHTVARQRVVGSLERTHWNGNTTALTVVQHGQTSERASNCEARSANLNHDASCQAASSGFGKHVLTTRVEIPPSLGTCSSRQRHSHLRVMHTFR